MSNSVRQKYRTELRAFLNFFLYDIIITWIQEYVVKYLLASVSRHLQVTGDT